MFKELRPALVVFGLLTVVTGLVYPGVVTVIGRLAFPEQATGSVIMRWGPRRRLRAVRPAVQRSRATSGAGPRPRARSPTTAARHPARTSARSIRRSPRRSPRASRRCARPIPATNAPVPVDLVTASGSGLDPHITPAAARLPGGPRGARARHDGGRSPCAHRAPHRGPDVRRPRRAAGQRAAAEPGTRFNALRDCD